jgi:hypothetical protein
MVLTRRQLQEQQQQQTAVASGDSPTHHPHSKTLQHQAMDLAAATKKSQLPNGRSTNKKSSTATTENWVYVLLVIFVLLTIVTIPVPFHPTAPEGPTVRHVFYYGWLTAMSTGLGALPFLLYPDVATFWVGISNGTWSLFCGPSSCATLHSFIILIVLS